MNYEALAKENIHIFLEYYQIKNEQGILIDFKDHAFLWDMYKDFTPKQAVLRAAQIGATTEEIIKTLWLAWAKGMDIIYVLPTQTDVNQFSGGKVNRIIANNPIFQRLTKDKDSVEQKQVGENIIYYRGSWGQKQAIMVSSDLNAYDEVDACFERGTEVLTKVGWKNIEDITKEDKVITLNQKDHRVVFQYPTDIITIKHSTECRFIANQIDIAVTPNHNMWAKTNEKYKLHTADSLLDARFKMTSAGVWRDYKNRNGLETIPFWQTKVKGKRINFNSRKVDAIAWYEFLAWYLSEGNVHKQRNRRGIQKCTGDIVITQKNQFEIDKITDCVNRLGLSYRIVKNRREISSIKIKDLHLSLYLQSLGYSEEKRIPQRYLYNRKEYLKIFLDTYVLGDGDDRNVITTKSKYMADDLQTIALQLGKTASISYEPNSGVYRVGIIKNQERRFNHYRSSNTTGKVEKSYLGYYKDMYCVTVPNGVLLVRGKDKKVPLWSGNCKPDVIEQYSTRLQHSKYRWEWYFSHPSAQGTGVDKYWQQSDQKHWFIKCSHCNKKQFLSFPESINETKEIFICKHCKKEITDQDRRKGEWIAKYKGREISGYWVPLLICPWVSAKQILDYRRDKSEEYFFNKVLGLPYVGGGNKLTKQHLMQNLTPDIIVPDHNERVVIGVDTGNNVHYVVGCQKGLFYYSEFSKGELNSNIDKYEEICELMDRWKRAIVIIDQGGDITGSRALREKYPGRVFLCSFGTDRKTKELVRWGANDEDGSVIADRNRCVQLVVDEFSDGRIPLQGKEDEWYHYWLHWNNLTRIKEFDQTTMEIKRKVWVRSGDDHWAMATTYWRIGMMRFAGTGSITTQVLKPQPNSYMIEPNDTVKVDLRKLTARQTVEERDWRD